MENCKCKVIEKIPLKDNDDFLKESFQLLIKYNNTKKYLIHTLYDTKIIFVYDRSNCLEH